MFKYFRPEEQSYAYVPDTQHPEKNRYGKSIETIPGGSELRGKSLDINSENYVSENPNRYKQHGFYFTADNCISCHACESACSEKNDLPAHLAFRSVGYVEGGEYPNYTRLNISMACNHCDNPVCLKGCPTRAYTKYAEYGAVLQDPDICFGCGYCTWVCPYNAPQLDTNAGHVSKCNMCVDRLEVGLKPACASACLAGALDFGVIETTPAGREQLEVSIPGFPVAEITHPNIRFQQKKQLPEIMGRTDSMPIEYVRDEVKKQYTSKARQSIDKISWGLDKLSTRENPLVVFTLVSQMVIGAFILLFAGWALDLNLFSPVNHPVAWPSILAGLIAIQTIALIMSTMHLGRPHRFYRAFNNLRYSPVSREVAGIAVFYNFLLVFTLLTSFPGLASELLGGGYYAVVMFAGSGGILSGIAAIYFMHKIYRIPARPFWNHWQTLSSFYGTMISLGALLVLVIYAYVETSSNGDWLHAIKILSPVIMLGLAMEAVGLIYHSCDLSQLEGEGKASYIEQITSFGKTYWARNLGIMTGLLLVVLLIAIATDTVTALTWLSLTAVIIMLSAVIGRLLFYALVIPTTMPGAFFWRNRKFESHARETGLAQMPQVGVLPDLH